MDLQLDHVTVGGRTLDRLTTAFERAGLPVEYGGEHSNGLTHMSILGFRDGSYIELISTTEPDTTTPKWNDPIHEDGGLCAWSVGVDDIEAATETLRDRGVHVDGPHDHERTREDGTVAEWTLAFLGGGDPGSMLPFLITDRTPRERRVQPTDGMDSSPIVGIETIVLGVPDLNGAIERFVTAFDVADPTMGRLTEPNADVAIFEGQPFALATPRDQNHWFADRIDTFGPRPVACLLGYDAGADVETGPDGDTNPAIDAQFDDLETGSIGERRIDWLPVTEPVDYRYLGLVPTTT